MKRRLAILLVLATGILIGCTAPGTVTPTDVPTPAGMSISKPADTLVPTNTPRFESPAPDFSPETAMPFTLTSPAFTQGQSIPMKYSCRGADVSPALTWNEPPMDTQSFVLLMEDPDAPAGTWDHWVLFNIPAQSRNLAEGFQPAAPIVTGRNSWGKSAYGGPCPPSGTHRYFFKLYALDTTLSLSGKATKADVLSAMQGHALAESELMGTFSK